VQRPANSFTAAAAAKLRLHEATQTPQRPAWLYRSAGGWRTGRLVLRGADLITECGGNVGAKGGAATHRR
jgi:hypothetical protein